MIVPSRASAREATRPLDEPAGRPRLAPLPDERWDGHLTAAAGMLPRDHLDERQVMDLIFTIEGYCLVAMAFQDLRRRA